MPFEGEGHVCYMDRFYTSPKVFKCLEDLGIGACGTCLQNRLQMTDEMKDSIDALDRY